MPRLARILHVAEKPSVAKSLAQTLASRGQFSNRQGSSRYNRLYEFEREGPIGSGVSLQVVTSVTGHLMGTAFAEPYNNWKSCPVRDLLCEDLVGVERKVPSDKMPLRRQLEAEARSAQVLVLWLDCDLEGEAIAYEVIEVCTRANPRLDVWRAKFSSLDSREVERAWNTLGRPNKNKSDAVEARSELDLRSGAAFTRFQTFRVQGKYRGVDDVVSYGPCQFPTLGFIVERQHEIDAHVPRDFWRIDLETRDKSVRWTWKRKRLYDRVPAFVVYELCCEAPALVIDSVESKSTSKWRPLPLQTIELQKRASRWLKMSSAETMDVAEKLYQRGYISYPRTETDKFNPESIDLKQILEQQRNDGRWGAHVARLLDDPSDQPSAFLWPKAGNRDDQAHPPIHPVKAAGTFENRKEEQIYELVARHFIACCSRDARGRKTNVSATLEPEHFDTHGLIVDQRNFLQVYTYEKWQGVELPQFSVGDKLDAQTEISKLELAQSTTEPPPGLTEADLLAKMDKHAIGTDATMAEHIKTVLAREYAVKNSANHVFSPTPLGLALVDAYDAMGERLNRPDLRAKLEADISHIATGAKRKKDVLKDALNTMRRCFDSVLKDAHKLDAAMNQRFADGPSSSNSTNTTTTGRQRRQPQQEEQNVFADPSGFSSQCGVCNGAMRLFVRQLADPTKRRLFLRCDVCHTSHTMPDNAEKFENRQEICALCGFKAIRVHTKFNTSYNCCPHCLRQPPKGAVFAGGDFTCHSCTADGCPLATGIKGSEMAVCQTCYQCNDRPMFLSRNQWTSFFVQCKDETSCGARIQLADGTASAKVTTNLCPRCSSTRLIQVQLERSKVPPGTPLNVEVCVACGDDRLQDLGFARRSTKLKQSSNASGNIISSSSRGAATKTSVASPAAVATGGRGAAADGGVGEARSTTPGRQQPGLPRRPSTSLQGRGKD